MYVQVYVFLPGEDSFFSSSSCYLSTLMLSILKGGRRSLRVQVQLSVNNITWRAVQIVYDRLQASANGIREVRSYTSFD